MVSSTSFKRCRSYFVGTFSGDTLSGDTSCRVQRGKRHFAGQIILFMCLNLFFLPPPHNYSLLCRLLRWMTLGYVTTLGAHAHIPEGIKISFKFEGNLSPLQKERELLFLEMLWQSLMTCRIED